MYSAVFVKNALHVPLLFSILSFGFIAGCGDRREGLAGSALKLPQSSTEALAWLSPLDRKSLEMWNSQLVKTCSARDIFVRSRGPEVTAGNPGYGIDLDSFFAITGGSLVVRRSNFEWMLLDSPTLRTADALSSTRVFTDPHSGGDDALLVEFRSAGSGCRVFIGGQLVYSIALVENFPVIAASGPVDRSGLSFTFKKNLGQNIDWAELNSPDLSKNVKSLLQPTIEKIAYLSTVFRMTPSQMADFFKPAPSSSTKLFYRFALMTGTADFSDSDDRIIGPDDELNIIADAKSFKRLSVALEIPRANLSAQSEQTDADILKLSASFPEINPTTPLSIDETLNRNAELFTECFNRRLRALKNLGEPINQAQKISPGFDSVVETCQLFSNRITSDLFDNPESNGLITSLWEGARARGFDYAGWDTLIKGWIIQNLERDESLLALKIRWKTSSFLTDLITEFQIGWTRFARFPELSAIRDQWAGMLVDWQLRRLRLNPSQSDLILRGLSNTVVTFRTSTFTLLKLLAEDPFREDAQSALRFAAFITPDYKRIAFEILFLSTTDHQSNDWIKNQFDHLLQNQISPTRLKCWQQVLQTKSSTSIFNLQRCKDEDTAPNWPELE
jgi:hypothetical protein